MAEHARASLIVPSWNGEPVLGACLGSLLAHLADRHEVIVVVNASTDGTEAVARSFATDERVRVVVNEANLGFARAVNQGLSLARGDLAILLNQDTETRDHWVDALVKAAGADARVGVIGCKLYFPGGAVQHAGGFVNARGEGSHFEADPGPADEHGLVDVAFVTGAAMGITRGALDAVGAFDEGFGLGYFEDVDWCFRAREAGFRVAYFAGASLIHLQQSAAGGLSFDAMFRYHCNRLRFVLKHFPAEHVAGAFERDERAWLESLGAGGEALVAAMQRAYFRHLGELSRTLAGCDPGDAALIEGALAGLRAAAPIRSLIA